MNRSPPASESEATEGRRLAWEQALTTSQLPGFVLDRLSAIGTGRAPWIATLNPAELLVARRHGMRPIAMVSGTCCYQYGWSWTDAQPAGWALAQARIRAEAVACGANAVVDVRLSIRPSGADDSMDFTLTGTAVRLKRPPSGPGPAVATVSAPEFVRLLERGIVPVGLAVGASYARFFDQSGVVAPGAQANSGGAYGAATSARRNRNLAKVGDFWEGLRRGAHSDLRRRAGFGNGVLAKVHWSQLDRVAGSEDTSCTYLGRHVVIGTVIRSQRGDRFATPVQLVVDMGDGVSPLNRKEGLDPDFYTERVKRGANE